MRVVVEGGQQQLAQLGRDLGVALALQSPRPEDALFARRQLRPLLDRVGQGASQRRPRHFQQARHSPHARRPLRPLARLGRLLLWRLGPVRQDDFYCGALVGGGLAARRRAAPRQQPASLLCPADCSLRLGRRPRCRPLSHRRHLWVVDDRLQSRGLRLGAACAQDLLHSRLDTARLRVAHGDIAALLATRAVRKGICTGRDRRGGGVLGCCGGSSALQVVCTVPQLGLLRLVSAGRTLGRAATLGTARVRSWRRPGGGWSCSSRSCCLWRVGGWSRLLPRLRRRPGTTAALALGDGLLGFDGLPGGGTHCSSSHGLIARVGTVLCCTGRCGLSCLDGCSGVALHDVQRVLCFPLLGCTSLAMASE